MAIELSINGLTHQLDLDPDTALIFALRDDLALHGAKLGCGLEQCGACVVLVDGQPIHSCTAPIGDLQGQQIQTVEGLMDEEGGLHAVQQAFLDLNAAQCGFCTAGIVLSSVALLAQNANPTREEICTALDGHLCRCGAQPRVIRAVERAAAQLRRGEK